MSAIRFLVLAVVLALGVSPGSAWAQSTLRVVMHSDVKILDPIWTTAYIVRNHGYMVYDTLFAMDAKGEIKPQMVDKYDVSADKLTYTITLRDGLLWHDGDARHHRGLRGLRQAVGGQGLPRPEDVHVREGDAGRQPEDLQDRPEGADGARAPGPRQAQLERALHDAQARGRHRSQHADLRLHRLRPLRVQEGRVEARRQGGLREVRAVQAAPGAAVGAGGRQGRQGGPRRVARRSPTTRRLSTRCSPARST